MGLDDLPGAAALYQQTFNAPPWNEGWDIEAASERLKAILSAPNGLGVVASRDDTPIAFALGYLERWVSGTHFQLKEMCTAPSEQRQGIGKSVLEFLLRTLKERDVSQVFCETRSGVPAEAFYRHAGFRTLNVVALGKRL
jgi:ribosomal protein S18 acetylase RimI-like enzyme